MTAIRQPWGAIAYLLLFGVGTIAGMIVITTALSTSFLHTARRFSSWNRRMTMASGLLSLAFGFFVAYQVGFVDGLFLDHPRWTPH
jgi:high-affinity nickel-transport protein